MGSSSSKTARKVPNVSSVAVKNEDEKNVVSISNPDKQFIDQVKKDLRETPELFVLNNIVMIVMFFENYQKLIEKVAPKRQEEDEDFIAPDVLLEEVNRNVKFRPVHGPKKEVLEPLVPKRIFVLNNSIKVISATESDTNAEIGTVRVEESPRKGYVRLRETHNTKPPSNSSSPQHTSEPNSRSSTESSDTLYGYTTINNIKTPKPIEILQGLNRQEVSSLPKTCISYRKVKKSCLDLEDEDDVSEDDLLETVSYVNSKAFMKYFETNLILDNVIERLGFDEEQIYSSQVIPGKVFCHLTEDESTIPCEIIPSILMGWPREQTLPFLMKCDRRHVPGKQYVFPTAGMIDKISSMKCVLVPRGFFKKRGEHSDSDIEWEVNFPQAERYLESYMSHAQIKAVLIMLTLHKTFIEPKTAQLGILAEHIRCFMLLECECNYSDWPEHRLGTKLISVIKNLISLLQQARPCIPDYFIEERNILENVPKKYIRAAQKVLSDILQSPLMYFIDSLRNLRYTRGDDFFPSVDFDRIYQILTKDTVAFPTYRKAPREEKKYKQKWYADNATRLRQLEEIKNRKNFMEQKRREEEKMKVIFEGEDGRRESVNSIDVNWSCDQEFDLHKKRAILTFFIKAMIDIAEKSLQISTLKQTRLFLKQAMYLTIILKDESFAFTDEVEEFLCKIHDMEKQCNSTELGAKSEESVRSNVRMRVKNIASDEIPATKNGVKTPRKSVSFVQVHTK